jgi:hypothetical protein
LHNLTVKEYVSPFSKKEEGIEKGELREYFELRNERIDLSERVEFEEDVVELIANVTVLNDRPSDPRLLDRSTNSQGPIEEGEMMVTVGTVGKEGADIVTFIDGLHLQSPQPGEVHFALMTDDLNINESPIFNTWEEDKEEGYMTKLISSNHTQRTVEVTDLDLNKDSQTKLLSTPPWFVGESNSTKTLDPSPEKIADFNRGGEGSWFTPMTSKIYPRGNSIR